jgi:hypothetical protein
VPDTIFRTRTWRRRRAARGVFVAFIYFAFPALPAFRRTRSFK